MNKKQIAKRIFIIVLTLGLMAILIGKYANDMNTKEFFGARLVWRIGLNEKTRT